MEEELKKEKEDQMEEYSSRVAILQNALQTGALGQLAALLVELENRQDTDPALMDKGIEEHVTMDHVQTIVIKDCVQVRSRKILQYVISKYLNLDLF